VLNARLVAIVAILFSIFSFATPGLIAQEGSTLPPGIQNVEIDGQAIDSATAPVTNNPTPEFSGRTELAVPTIDLIVTGAEPIRFTVELDNRGRFRAAVPQPLADGQYTLAINDVPVGAFSIDSAAQVAADDDGESQSRPLLDIARVVPYPVDFGDALPGIGFLDGRFYTLDEEAARTAAANGSDSADGLRETRRGLASAGWLQRYENRLAVPNPENPDVFDIQISSFVVEYAFPEDASAAFASLTADDPAVEVAPVGEESALTLLTGVTPDTEAEYQAARFMFRVGPMLGMIVYADLLGQQPDLALLESVAQSVAARGAVVAEGGSIPLGAMALQLDPSSASGRLVQRDLYDVRAGVLTALFAEDEATRESRVALFTGTTDAFSATTNGVFAAESENRGNRDREQNQEQDQAPELELAAGWQQDAAPTPTSVISIEGGSESEEAPAAPTSVIGVEGETPAPDSVIIVEGETPVPAASPAPPAEETSDGASEAESDASAEQPPAQIFMTNALYAFPGEADASAWLDAQRERLVAGAAEGSGTFAEVPDAPALGDASATFSTQRAIGAGEEIANGFRFYGRVGAIVAVMEIGSSAELPLNNASRIMELQVECIQANGCPGLASLAGRFVGGVEIPEHAAEQPDQEESEQPREPRPEREPRERQQQPEPPPVQEQPPPAVEEPTPIPIEEPTPIPIEEPTQPPVEEPTAPPVDEGTPPPVDEGTPPPAAEPTLPPEGEPTPPPAEEPTPPPVEEPTQPPEGEPTPPPAEEPTPPPAEEPTQPPVTEPTAIPTPGPDLEETPPEEEPDRRNNDRDRDRDRDRRGGRD
jgi:hypothetical protein